MSRSNTPSVTLFPFLAVLMCTMGALIVLLLVTTLRIREQVEDTALQQSPAQLAPEDLPVLPDLVSDQEEAAFRAAQRDAVLKNLSRTQAEQQQQLAKLRQQWNTHIAAVQQQRAELHAESALLQQRAELLDRDARAAVTELRKLEQRLALVPAARQSLEASYARDAAEFSQLQELEDKLRKELEELKLSYVLSRPEFQVVAFDSKTGTSRRPILIECTAEEIRFGSERITLTAQQLNGYPPESNPLLAGSQALSEYWTAVDARALPGAPPPYILLLVRPRGTVAFYVARQLLEKLDQPFGYELLREDEAIRWPAPDPGAVAVCRKAVDQALALPKADPVLPRGGRGLGGGNGGGRGVGTGLSLAEELPTVVDARGNFSLPEVDRLRRAPEDKSLSLQPEWAPQRRPLDEKPNPLAQDGPRSAGGVAARSFAEQVERAKADRQRSSSQGGEAGSADDADLASRPEGLRNWMEDGGPKRKWGQPNPGASIGIEKDVKLHLYADRISIEKGASFATPAGIDKADVQGAVAAILDAEAKSWGQPPQMFVWRPSLIVVIHPGGNRHHPAVKELTDHWELNTKVERALK